MFDDVISTGLQAVLAEVFESVDKNQLNVSLVGDIFKESHLELTDLRLKKTLLKDMNLPVEVKEGLVGKLVIQGLSGELQNCCCCAGRRQRCVGVIHRLLQYIIRYASI